MHLGKFYIMLLMLLFILSGCNQRIIQRPIVFDAERKALSLEYLENRYGMKQSAPTIIPKMVVVHWTAIPTLEKSFEAFDPARLPNFRQEIATASALNVGVQFLVDRDGTIYQLLPETAFARHVIGLNHCAIGIENVGDGREHPLTDAQLAANSWLIKRLIKRHPIEYVIGHHEYTLFEGHPLWKEVDAGYRTQKEDPGDRFMQRLREALEGQDLKPIPYK